MNPRISLTGRTFGRLTVINREGVNAFGNSMWMCQCQCGNTTTVLYQHLRNGRTKSCGCLKRGAAQPVEKDWL